MDTLRLPLFHLKHISSEWNRSMTFSPRKRKGLASKRMEHLLCSHSAQKLKNLNTEFFLPNIIIIAN